MSTRKLKYNTVKKDKLLKKRIRVSQSFINYEARNIKPVSLLPAHPCILLQQKLGRNVWNIVINFLYGNIIQSPGSIVTTILKFHHANIYRQFLIDQLNKEMYTRNPAKKLLLIQKIKEIELDMNNVRDMRKRGIGSLNFKPVQLDPLHNCIISYFYQHNHNFNY